MFDNILSIPINNIRTKTFKEDLNTKSTDIQINTTENENISNLKNDICLKFFNESKQIIIDNKPKSKNNNKIIKENNILTEKPIFYIPIDYILKNNIYNPIKIINEKIYTILNDKENKKEKKDYKNNFIIYQNKPIFNIPIQIIKKEIFKKGEKMPKIKNIVNENKNVILNKVPNENENFNISLNNNIFSKKQGININLNNNFNAYIDFAKNNIFYYDLLSKYNQLKLFEEMAQLKVLKEMGLNSIMNQNNINYYLFNNITNNIIKNK